MEGGAKYALSTVSEVMKVSSAVGGSGRPAQMLSQAAQMRPSQQGAGGSSSRDRRRPSIAQIPLRAVQVVGLHG